MGYSQEGSVFLSQKIRSSEQFLSLESTRKCLNINKIPPSNSQKTVRVKILLFQANCSTSPCILTFPQLKRLHTSQDPSANACRQWCTRFSRYIRTPVSSGILALHPHVFNLFLSHLFSSQPHQMHMKTRPFPHSQLPLPPTAEMPHCCRAAGSDLPFSSPLPFPSQTRFLF